MTREETLAAIGSVKHQSQRGVILLAKTLGGRGFNCTRQLHVRLVIVLTLGFVNNEVVSW